MMNLPAENAAAEHKPFTGRHMLLIMLAFFGVIIAVNATMAILGARTWTGLEVKNTYVASQNYNARLATADRQRARGWQSSLVHAGSALTLTITNSVGDAVRGAKIDGETRRPVQEGDDRPLAFHETEPGVYRAQAPGRPGLWDVDVQVLTPGDEPYRQIFRILVKE